TARSTACAYSRRTARRSARSSCRKWPRTPASAATTTTGCSSPPAPRCMRWTWGRGASSCKPSDRGRREAAALLDRRRGHQHESAAFIVVRSVGRVHGCENVGGLHPDRRVFVARDVEDKEAVSFGVIGGQRRNMAADLLAERLA